MSFLETLITEKKVKWCDDQTFQPFILQLTKPLLVVGTPYEEVLSLETIGKVFPVDIWDDLGEDEIYIGVFKQAIKTRNGVESKMTAFTPSSYSKIKGNLA